jgi:hypothetical protein
MPTLHSARIISNIFKTFIVIHLCLYYIIILLPAFRQKHFQPTVWQKIVKNLLSQMALKPNKSELTGN